MYAIHTLYDIKGGYRKLMDFNILTDESSLYRVFEWIARLVYVNVLWVLFTLVGLVFFGVMPSTLAVFMIINKWINGKENVRVFSEFWQVYKDNFIKTNIIGVIMFLIGFILLFDLNYLQSLNNTFYSILKYFIYFLLFIYFIDLFYIFPIYIKYDLKIINILKNSLFFAFLTPIETLQIIFGMVFIYIFFRFLPSLLPFLSISLPVLLIAWVSSKTIFKVEEKIRQNKSQK